MLTLIVLLAAPRSAPAEWIAAGLLGGATTHRAALDIEQPSRGTALEIDGVAFAGRSFDAPVYYGSRLMWARGREARVGIEAEFIHLKVYADTRASVDVRGTLRGSATGGTMQLDELVQRFAISHGLNLLFGNVVLRRPLAGGAVANPRFVLAARLGAGPTIPHGESTIEGTAQEQYQLGRVAGQAAAGLEWRFARRLAAVAEYKLTATAQRVRIPEGTASATFVSHHLVVGLGWRFR